MAHYLQWLCLARRCARRSYELGRLPGWSTAITPLFWQRLSDREGGVSSGTLVAILRHATRQRQMMVSKDVFVMLLERTEAANVFWARQTVRRIAGIAPEMARMMQDDLHQELTLHLWEELAPRKNEAWELFFRRAITFARAHVATRYLERHGYRHGKRLVLFFADVAASATQAESDDEGTLIARALVEPRDPFDAADLADLRGYVEQLPARERAAVVMRYWQHAHEPEIANALGVTSRTVRNLLHRANLHLYALYIGSDQAATKATKTIEEGGAV